MTVRGQGQGECHSAHLAVAVIQPRSFFFFFNQQAVRCFSGHAEAGRSFHNYSTDLGTARLNPPLVGRASCLVLSVSYVPLLRREHGAGLFACVQPQEDPRNRDGGGAQRLVSNHGRRQAGDAWLGPKGR